MLGREGQAMIHVEPTIAALVKAQDAANVYLGNVLGAEYCATNGFYGNDHWYFLTAIGVSMGNALLGSAKLLSTPSPVRLPR